MSAFSLSYLLDVLSSFFVLLFHLWKNSKCFEIKKNQTKITLIKQNKRNLTYSTALCAKGGNPRSIALEWLHKKSSNPSSFCGHSQVWSCHRSCQAEVNLTFYARTNMLYYLILLNKILRGVNKMRFLIWVIFLSQINMDCLKWKKLTIALPVTGHTSCSHNLPFLLPR